MLTLISAVKYHHSIGIAHGDIKGDNIMLARKNKLKLIDFGEHNNSQTADVTAYTNTCYVYACGIIDILLSVSATDG